MDAEVERMQSSAAQQSDLNSVDGELNRTTEERDRWKYRYEQAQLTAAEATQEMEETLGTQKRLKRKWRQCAQDGSWTADEDDQYDTEEEWQEGDDHGQDDHGGDEDDNGNGHGGAQQDQTVEIDPKDTSQQQGVRHVRQGPTVVRLPPRPVVPHLSLLHAQ